MEGVRIMFNFNTDAIIIEASIIDSGSLYEFTQDIQTLNSIYESAVQKTLVQRFTDFITSIIKRIIEFFNNRIKWLKNLIKPEKKQATVKDKLEHIKQGGVYNSNTTPVDVPPVDTPPVNVPKVVPFTKPPKSTVKIPAKLMTTSLDFSWVTKCLTKYTENIGTFYDKINNQGASGIVDNLLFMNTDEETLKFNLYNEILRGSRIGPRIDYTPQGIIDLYYGPMQDVEISSLDKGKLSAYEKTLYDTADYFIKYKDELTHQLQIINNGFDSQLGKIIDDYESKGMTKEKINMEKTLQSIITFVSRRVSTAIHVVFTFMRVITVMAPIYTGTISRIENYKK
jgi:hypothetical protein